MLPDELGVIGCCLLGGLATASDAVEKLKPSDFLGDDCRDAFEIICKLVDSASEVSPSTLEKAWTKTVARPITSELLLSPDQVPSAENLTFYLCPLLDSARKRRVTSAAQGILDMAVDDEVTADQLLARAEADLFAEEIRSVETVDSRTAATLFIDDLQRRFDLQGKLPGLETPWGQLNNRLDGIQYGEQMIVGARAGTGKTAFAVNLASHAAWTLGIPTLFVTLEMSTTALMRRFFCGIECVHMGDVRRGNYTEEQFSAMSRFTAEAKTKPIWFVEGIGGMGISALCAAVRRLVRKHGVKLVLVDYLQKIVPTEAHEKRTYEVGAVSGQLVALARSTKVALVTLAQLNREPDKFTGGGKADMPGPGRLPRLSDLADSGQIERDADVVLLLHRDKEDQEGNAVFYVAKQRDGETGKIPVIFNGKFCRFENKPFSD